MSKQPVNPELVRDIVLVDCGITVDDLQSGARTERVVFARAAITTVLHEYTGMSYPEIAILTRGRRATHSSAIEAHRRIIEGKHDADASVIFGVPTTGMEYARYVWHRADEKGLVLSSTRKVVA